MAESLKPIRNSLCYRHCAVLVSEIHPEKGFLCSQPHVAAGCLGLAWLTLLQRAFEQPVSCPAVHSALKERVLKGHLGSLDHRALWSLLTKPF